MVLAVDQQATSAQDLALDHVARNIGTVVVLVTTAMQDVRLHLAPAKSQPTEPVVPMAFHVQGLDLVIVARSMITAEVRLTFVEVGARLRMAVVIF
jgi:hypothetical protein